MFLEVKMQRTNKVPRYFEMLKFIRKDNICIFRLFQQTKKVQCIYLPFRNQKPSNKIGQQWSKS